MRQLLTSMLLSMAAPVVAGDAAWQPVSTFAFPATKVQDGRYRHVGSIEIAPDAGVAVFFLSWNVAEKGLPDTIIASDLVSGKELSQHEGVFLNARFSGISPNGQKAILVPSVLAGYGNAPSLWSRSGGIQGIYGPRPPTGRPEGKVVARATIAQAGRGCFSPDGRRIALVGDEEGGTRATSEGGTESVYHPAIVVLNLDGTSDSVFAIPRVEWDTPHEGWHCTWSRDGSSLFVAISQRHKTYAKMGPEVWREPSAALWRLDLDTGSWRRLADLPLTFGGFTATEEVVVWDSNVFPRRQILRVPISTLDSVRADGNWWAQFAPSARFERIIPADSDPYLTVVAVYIGEHRSYALVVRGTRNEPNEPKEIWERVDPPATPIGTGPTGK